jgi:hypothetical protein
MVRADINPTIEIAEFRPEFPPGTMVRDDRHNARQGNAPHEYLVREDGAKRAILPAERSRNAKYEDLASTEPGRAELYKGESSLILWWLAIVSALAMGGLVAWFVGYRRP